MYRLRYLLKMMGADTFTYITTMFITDLFYLFVIVNMAFGILFAYNYDNYYIRFEDLNWNLVVGLILCTCVWGVSFIAQSYLYQYRITEKRRGVGYVPISLFLINFIPIPLMGIFISFAAIALGTLLNNLTTLKIFF